MASDNDIIVIFDDGDEYHVSLSSLRSELALKGLHIVNDHDMNVLKACRELPESTIRLNTDGLSLVGWPGSVCNVWAAETARRNNNSRMKGNNPDANQ